MKKGNAMLYAKKIIFGFGVIFLLLVGKLSSGQQDPMFTQYSFNTQTINPAYAGTWESMGFLVLGRYQWVGMNGAPLTYTFSMQTPTRYPKVALGLNVIKDQIGREQRLSLMGDYSYRLQISQNTHLRMGLKFGITNYSNALSSYIQDPDSPTDPMALDDIDMKNMPNFGIGAFLYSPDYYVGFSIPKILNNQFTNDYANYSTEAEIRHLFLQGGVVMPISQDLMFKPTFLAKASFGAPIEAELTGNFLIRDQFWIGAMFRTRAGYGVIAQWIIDKKLRIGYAMDFSINKFRSYHNATHEIMISYEIGLKRKWSTPRRF